MENAGCRRGWHFVVGGYSYWCAPSGGSALRSFNDRLDVRNTIMIVAGPSVSRLSAKAMRLCRIVQAEGSVVPRKFSRTRVRSAHLRKVVRRKLKLIMSATTGSYESFRD